MLSWGVYDTLYVQERYGVCILCRKLLKKMILLRLRAIIFDKFKSQPNIRLFDFGRALHVVINLKLQS
jgi:hypothetical protein